MDNSLTFSDKQWHFLATIDAFSDPVHLDTVGLAARLSPGQLVALLEICEERQILNKISAGVYAIGDELPPKIQSRIQALNTRERYKEILALLQESLVFDELPLKSRIQILTRSGHTKSVGVLEGEAGAKAMEQAEYEQALRFYSQALEHLQPFKDQNPRRFIIYTFEHSDLCVGLNRNFTEAIRYLREACSICRRLGDKRSEALTRFQIGHLYFMLFLRTEALAEMAAGVRIVEELDDDDIRNRSAQHMGMYYYTQGRLNEAIVLFERAFRDFETHSGNRIINPITPLFYGICGTYLGQFHKCIGCLDSALRYVTRKQNPRLATTIKAVLGMSLLLIKKKQEGLQYLNKAFEEALTDDNRIARYFSVQGLIYHAFNEGNIDEAYELAKTQVAVRDKQFESFNLDIDPKMIRHFTPTWLFEILYEFERQGYPPIPKAGFREKVEDYLNDPSIHLQGIGLRYKAILMSAETSNSLEIHELLLKSEQLLKQSGDPIQTAKTRIQIACFELNRDNREEARTYARKARKGLSGFWEDVFPDGIRALTEEESVSNGSPEMATANVERFFQMTRDVGVPSSMEDGLDMLLSIMNRFFRAERGGLFWTSEKSSKTLMLKSSYNLNDDDVTAPVFRSNMKFILRAFKQNQAVIIKPEDLSKIDSNGRTKTLLCLPLTVDGTVRGVLYHDNSFLDDCFDFIDQELIKQLRERIDTQISRAIKFNNLMEETRETTIRESTGHDQPGSRSIIAQSPVMLKVLKQAEKIAAADSSVLILGESGSGKELLARRIHSRSPRSRKPFVIIDPTTIPENLMESELFGYEKGAFTGADRRKIGRVELAHQGTLFIDEIGEIPLPAQSKLLRLLQEKTFTRVGSNQPLSSDFRLVASTNRDLAAEVKAGNFREDLFYRINIIPVNLPPLREREDDVIMLARHFVDYYRKKFNYPDIEMTAEDEQKIVNYAWPGNVRELVNVIERSIILSTGNRLELDQLMEPNQDKETLFSDNPTMDELQRRYIVRILEQTKGRVGGPGGAAEILGMKRTTLYSRMKKFNIPV